MLDELEIEPDWDAMPAPVDLSTNEALSRIEQLLEEKRPDLLASLQPGLLDGKIDELLQPHGLELPDDLRALYCWRNGMAWDCTEYFFHIYRFMSLPDALARRELSEKGARQGFGFDPVADSIAEQQFGWIELFDDMGGDGYFFDFYRHWSRVAVFFHSRGVAEFVFYPSLANLLSEFLEWFRHGFFSLDDVSSPGELREFSDSVRSRFGLHIPPLGT